MGPIFPDFLKIGAVEADMGPVHLFDHRSRTAVINDGIETAAIFLKIPH